MGATRGSQAPRQGGLRRGRRSVWALGLVVAVAAVLVGPVAADGRDRPLDAKLVRSEGGKVRLSEVRGRPVLLELWASWCLPCREQTEILEGLGEVLATRGIDVYAVNVGETPETVRAHQAREQSAFPVWLDRVQAIPTRLGIERLPALVLLAPDGTVAARAVGVTRREKVLELLDRLE